MFLDFQFIADLVCHCFPLLNVNESPAIKTLHVPHRDSSHLVTLAVDFSNLNRASVKCRFKFLGCRRLTI